jgi:hypothetical protein
MAQYNRNIDLYIMDLNITTLSTTLDENAQSLGFKTIMVLTSAITEPNISSEPIPRTHFWIWLIFQIYGKILCFLMGLFQNQKELASTHRIPSPSTQKSDLNSKIYKRQLCNISSSKCIKKKKWT